MFGNRFYNQTTRRYVAIFGTLFNDIKIGRSKDNINIDFLIDIPVNYGPMQKFLARFEQDPDFDAPAMTLPRVTFEITNVAYDGTRKLTNAISNSVISGDKNVLRTRYTPAPYNLDFQLNIMTKYTEDGTKILEQILPFFKPEQTLSVKLLDEMDVYFDIPIVLNSVVTEDTYEADFQTRRALIWTLNFTLKGYYFGPVIDKKIVKFVRSNIFDDTLDKVETVSLQTSSSTSTIVDDIIEGVENFVYFDVFETSNGEIFGISNTDSFDVNRNANTSPFILQEELPDITINYGDTLNIINESNEYSLVILNSIIDPDTGGFGFDVDNVISGDEVEGQPTLGGSTLKFTPTKAGEFYYISPENTDFAGIITVQGDNLNMGLIEDTSDGIIDQDENSKNYTNLGDLPSSIVETTPGLTSSGTPTKNPNETLPFSEIDWDDNWDYIVEITDGDDYDPD